MLSCHTGKPLICADYVTLIRADQRYVVSANQRLSRMATCAKRH